MLWDGGPSRPPASSSNLFPIRSEQQTREKAQCPASFLRALSLLHCQNALLSCWKEKVSSLCSTHWKVSWKVSLFSWTERKTSVPQTKKEKRWQQTTTKTKIILLNTRKKKVSWQQIFSLGSTWRKKLWLFYCFTHFKKKNILTLLKKQTKNK